MCFEFALVLEKRMRKYFNFGDIQAQNYVCLVALL